jgi:cytochrome b6-f complex iron-sulfur subunit
MVPPMQPEATPDRRTVVIAAVLGGSGLGTLAACGSDASATSTLATSGTSGTSATATAGSGTPGASVRASPSPAGGSGPSLVALDQVPIGGSVVVTGPSGKVAVAQPTAGQVVAFTAICTHQACTVMAAGKRLQCPCHGSVFDAFSGEVVKGPAQAPLGKVDVSVSGQDVVAG